MTTVPFLRSDIEVMAPAGSYESLRAALAAGADSVYFGIGHLNMRSRSAANFELPDLSEISNICQDFGARSYLALNTVMFDRELDLVRRVIEEAHHSGISAIIASDQSVLEYARSLGVEIHLSTQLNVSNFPTTQFYSRYADVMVLARELDLEQVSEISRQIGAAQLKGPKGKTIKLEMFVHGALCMAISGKCYLSLHQYGSSANRGSCLQGCRRSYLVTDRETGDELTVENEYIMSPQDLCTIGFLDRILASGVTVLKIEGRARPPEYVSTVTRCYREAVESIIDGSYSRERIEEWTRMLATVFNRGFWDGYYLGQRLGEWSEVYGSMATKRRVYLARGIKYFPKIGVGEFLMETGSLRRGDLVFITGPTTGLIEIEIDEIHFEERPAEEVGKGDHFSIRVPRKIRPSDKLFKWVEA